VEAAAEAVRKSDWPGAEDFARKQLLEPLTRAEATSFMQQMAEARARGARA
jgi:hypothetical protein